MAKSNRRAVTGSGGLNVSVPARATRIDLPPRVRNRVCEVLQARLLDSLDLYAQIKQAHWTVQGENFIALHELFDRIAGEVDGYADEIAERIQTLGGHALGAPALVGARSALPPYPLAAVCSRDHVRAVATALAAYGKLVRQAIDQCDRAGDADSADLFTSVSRGVDKSLWFVEAHEAPGSPE